MSSPDHQPAAVPRPVKGLALVSLFNDFASEMVYPLLPAFVTVYLGAGAVALGVLDGAADLTSSALKLVSGRLADRPGWRKPLILAGYGTAILVRPLVAVAGAAWQVVGFRVIDRVGKGLRTPPRDALIAAVTPPASRGRSFGFHRAADHFGAVLGSLAAWYLLSLGADVRRVIAWSGAPGLLAFAVLAVVLRDRQTARDVPSSQATGLDAAGKIFWAPVTVLAALTFVRLPETLFLLYLQQQGLPIPLVPLAWAGLHVVRSLSSYPGGRFADRMGASAGVAASGLLFAGTMAALAFARGPGAAVAVFLVLGLATGLTEAAERSLIAALAPVRTGRRFGAYHALTGFAALPAGLAFGLVYQKLGGSGALLVSAGGTMVAVLAWVLVSPRPFAGGRA